MIIKGSKIIIKIGDPILNNSVLSIIARSNNLNYDFNQIKNEDCLSVFFISKLLSEVSLKKIESKYEGNISHYNLENPKKFTSKDVKDLDHPNIEIHNILSFGLYDIASSSILEAYNILERRGDNDFIDDLISEKYDPFDNSLETFEENEIVVISDLDKTQKLAIANSLKNSSFIWGPPGTGKSETITNILANLINQSKKTLFITEKQVASDVVYDRMSLLNNFVLKIHAKETPKSFHEKIKKTSKIILNYIKFGNIDIDNFNKEYSNSYEYIDEYNNEKNNFLTYQKLFQTKEGTNYLKNLLSFDFDEELLKKYQQYDSKLQKIIFEIIQNLDFDQNKILEAKRSLLIINYITQNYINLDEYFKFKNEFLEYQNSNELNESLEYLLKLDQEKLDKYKELYKIVSDKLNIFNDYNEIEKLIKVISDYKLEFILKFIDLYSKNKSLILIYKSIEGIINFFDKDVCSEILELALKFKAKQLIKWSFNLEVFNLKSLKVKFKNRKNFKIWKIKNQNLINSIIILQKNLSTSFKLFKILPNYSIKEFINNYSEINSLNKLHLVSKQIELFDINSEKTIKIIFNQLKETSFFQKIYENHLNLESISKINKVLNEDSLIKPVNKADFAILNNLISNFSLHKELKDFYKNDLKIPHLIQIWSLYFEIKNSKNINSINSDYLENIAKHLKLRKNNAINEIIENHLIYIKKNIKTMVKTAKPSGFVSYMELFSKMIRHIDGVKTNIKISTYFQHYSELIKLFFPIIISSPEEISNSTRFPLIKKEFDYAIFDEASQIFTEKALPVMYRSKKYIISGDDKQLPPTNFFKSKDDQDYDSLEDEVETIEENEILTVLQNESLLDFSKSRFKNYMLKFHYRSKYKELINFSNNKFYESKLIVVDNPEIPNKPIEMIDVNGMWENQNNLVEAEIIVKKIINIIDGSKEVYNGKSIGVITFNQKQQSLIEDLLEEASHTNDKLFNLMTPNFTEDYLFVKNIENVQGDERDIILFSIGFANNKDGKFINNFGPIGRVGGERRLNVAISRAKEKMIIVKSIPASIIQSNTQSGNLFKEFLIYAENLQDNKNLSCDKISKNNYDETMHNNSKEDSIDFFKNDVVKKLKEILNNSYQIVENLQINNFYLPIVIKEKTTNNFLLGIILDNENLLLNYSKLDDELQIHNFLKARGWTLARILSNQWFSLSESNMKIEKLKKIINEKTKIVL
ncbi:hypothetical protein EELLY_v1c07900 [Entomoplasma ellychniae]|uniref:Superfamily I DNA/RNA helicase n=1 Tax=Entomoplasma ellychniae TaxID=2114 RepID=A0A8E2UD71_9MOLU|nr:AAA domain-containing protein [Entomoplasma ellychniae]PPE05102.1 hypothetical protein EELLY_v1c07900 [Entomoplasma ellychniae]